MPTKETVVGINGVDRVFHTDGSFTDTVAFFDKQFEGDGYHVITRIAAPIATAWSVKRPDGSKANVVVRRTSPVVTIELTEVSPAPPTIPLH